ncbi:hypothetical protein GCM10011609_82420 [Lentzea pudingi]|uniref:Guanylate cyclase domain-containing protein n=1 Tax=Lentzea pudingi TaxID=1789439 RepID=A0ABQ2IUB3_9PSEU|nr:hypothetical protein [Lentzea pudingi]GGN27233.1 hypothetical protein GCM10011609_82420 [Lentzea pudingi]
MTETAERLPPYRAVLVVDMENYSGHTAAQQREFTEIIPDLLQRAFERAGRAEVWEERRFPDSTGDGYAVGFRPESLPLLIGPFLDALQSELAYYDRILRSGDRKSRLRLRAAITVGPLYESDSPRLGDGCGDSRVAAHRLVDAVEVRRLLELSDPDVTFLAAVISDRVHEDVVLGGHTTKSPSDYVRTSVSVKQFRGDAHLYVPKPSGDLLSRGFSEDAEAKGDVRGPAEVGDVRNEFSGKASGRVVQAGSIGQLKQDNRDQSNRISVRGNSNTVAGRDIRGGRP